MNSWAVSACYPRSTFYPLSDGPSIQNHRITKTYFSYLLDVSVSQSSALLPFILCDRFPTGLSAPSYSPLPFRRRPPQSNCPPYTVLDPDYGPELEPQHARVVFQGWLHANWRPRFKASHLSYTSRLKVQCKTTVKVHGVFPSSRGYTASSQRFQFH